jgi:hypothetical protein
VLEVGDGEARAEHVRVEYDVDRTMRGIRDSGLSGEFADQLRTGGAK